MSKFAVVLLTKAAQNSSITDTEAEARTMAMAKRASLSPQNEHLYDVFVMEVKAKAVRMSPPIVMEEVR